MMIPLGPRCANCGRQFLGGQPDSRGWCVRCHASEREQLRQGLVLPTRIAEVPQQQVPSQELTTGTPPGTCEVCHRPLIARRPQARTCSARCRQRLSRRLRKPGLERECPICHRVFFPYRASAVYCSTLCRQREWRSWSTLRKFVREHYRREQEG
jgi:uncharacterized OB-fold protein